MDLLAAIFLNSIILISGKLVLPEFTHNRIEENYSSEVYLPDASNKSENLWVLDLSVELKTLKLRRGTKQDEEDFDLECGPVIEGYLRRQNSIGTVKKSAPKPLSALNLNKKVTQEDVFKYLNKFALHSKLQPDMFLTESHEADEPNISIYFKGGFTSLVVNAGVRQWHYFITPSPFLQFPSWFYMDHHAETKSDVREVPKDVTEEMYPVLYRLLYSLLRYPV